jgi:hypothetical protein
MVATGGGMPKLVEHVHSYKGKYCEAKPGDPPMMVPKDGTNCAQCKARLAEHRAKMKVFEIAEGRRRKVLEAEWAQTDKKAGGE